MLMQVLKGAPYRAGMATNCSPQCSMLISAKPSLPPTQPERPSRLQWSRKVRVAQRCSGLAARGTPIQCPHKALQICLQTPCTRRVAKSPVDVTKSHALQPRLRFLPLTVLKWRQGSVRCFLFSLPKTL